MTVSPSRKQFPLRIEETVLEKLRSLAAEREQPLNRFICDLLEEHVQQAKLTPAPKQKEEPKWWIS